MKNKNDEKSKTTARLVSVLLKLNSHFALMNQEHISSHEVMVTLSLTHNSNVLLIFLALKLYVLTVTTPQTAGHPKTQTMQTADCRLQTADRADRAD